MVSEECREKVVKWILENSWLFDDVEDAVRIVRTVDARPGHGWLLQRSMKKELIEKICEPMEESVCWIPVMFEEDIVDYEVRDAVVLDIIKCDDTRLYILCLDLLKQCGEEE